MSVRRLYSQSAEDEQLPILSLPAVNFRQDRRWLPGWVFLAFERALNLLFPATATLSVLALETAWDETCICSGVDWA